MTGYLDILSELILLSTFMLVGSKRISSYIKAFRLQSALIVIGAAIMGIETFINDGHIDILIICSLMLFIKVIFIPNYLNKVNSRVVNVIEKDFFLNIPILIVISCVLVVFTYFTLTNVEAFKFGSKNMEMVNLLSVVLIGLLFIITRKKAIGQIIGFLVIENGIFVTAMYATNGMPFIVDLGIFIDLLTGVLIMGLMVFKIDEQFESININRLKKLKG